MRLFWFILTPIQVFTLSFVLIILIGTAVLTVPAAVNGEPLSFIDALFTSTSAMCVTGLIVADTGSKFTFFGQAVIITLIQVGGLGIMTFSTFILLVIGKKIGLTGSYLVQEGFSESGSLRISRLIFFIIIFTAVMECTGALFLFFDFKDETGCGYAVWSSVFHSISAFCNAGFSLNADSFCRYRDNIPVNLVMTTLIIMGGIGFPVVLEVLRYCRCAVRRKRARLNIHTRIVLIVTAALLIIGTGILYISEPQCHAGKHPALTAYFQSVTARTAGFNTIQFSNASDATLCATNALMFVGGSSGSTAGGIKTTTLMVILILAWAHISGRERPEFSNRTISQKNTVKALSLLVLFLIIVLIATFSLLLIHEYRDIPRPFQGALFEVVSAIGTVGLSTGFTGHLTCAGKLIIICVMFLGRLGPLAIARVFISGKQRKGMYTYPEENLMIG